MFPVDESGPKWRLEPGEAWDPSYILQHADNPNLHLIATHAVQRLFYDGSVSIGSLTAGQRMLLSAAEVENHVNQAGFSKLWCYGGWALKHAIDGHRLIGAERLADVLAQALEVVDWSQAGNEDCEISDEQNERFEALNSDYYDLDHASRVSEGAYDLGAMKNRYLLAHPHEFPRLDP